MLQRCSQQPWQAQKASTTRPYRSWKSRLIILLLYLCMLSFLFHRISTRPTCSLSTVMFSAAPSRARPPRHHNSRRHATAATAATAPYFKPSPAPLTDVSSSSTPVTRPPSQAAMASNFSLVRFRDFAERGQISDQVLRGIPFEFCTHVQAETLDVVLKGTDVYVCAVL